jgi:hypothetical protein
VPEESAIGVGEIHAARLIRVQVGIRQLLSRAVKRGLAAVAAVALVAVALPATASAKRVAGVNVKPGCDLVDPAVCLFPWPNDAFTKRDKSTATGRRLHLLRSATPRNKAGKPIDPTDMNRADGFSPGSMLLTKVPGLDSERALARSRVAGQTDIGRYLAPKAPIVVINAKTGDRHPVWAEIDVNPTNPRERVLIIRPARNFEEGQRYIVALRNLKTARGRTIKAGRGLRIYRDRIRTRSKAIERRRGHYESIFRSLKREGIRRKQLYLAWDFTVASERSLAGRILHIRDDAFRALGDRNLRDLKVQGRSPAFTVTSATDFSPAQDDRVARHVEGTLTVPCYLTNGCAPGGRFALDRRGLPRRMGTTTARFVCNIPRSVLDPGVVARPALYGHGLLGDPDEIDAGNVKAMGNEHQFVFCATAWAGFSTEDVPQVVKALGDLSLFNTLSDRMQQGYLNMLYLGRAMIHPQGFGSNPAFQKNGQSLIDGRRLFYDGNSQGGIMGGGLTAVAPDFDHAVLGVPGMNYSTLLQRSVDFDSYAALIYPNYPRQLDRQLFLSLIQLLWDRGEADGYAQHMTTDPLPNTPRHRVLMHVAFGDHQVANLTALNMARTIGARVRVPALDPGRSPLRQPLFGLRTFSSYPYSGSALVWWDTGPVRTENGETVGTPPPPVENVPPREGDDPHSAPRSMATARQQKSDFLRIGGRVVNVCGAGPCYAGTWTGP